MWSEKVRVFYEDEEAADLLEDISIEFLEELRDVSGRQRDLYGITLYECRSQISKIAIDLIDEYLENDKEEYKCFEDFLQQQLLQCPKLFQYIKPRLDFEKIDNSVNT